MHIGSPRRSTFYPEEFVKGSARLFLPRDKTSLRSTAEVAAILHAVHDQILTAASEKLFLVGIDDNGDLAGVEHIRTGQIHKVDVDLRDFIHFREALKRSGVDVERVIMVHNHPGNTPEPSDADINTSLAMRNRLLEHDIELVDSIVVGGVSKIRFTRELMMAHYALGDTQRATLDRIIKQDWLLRDRKDQVIAHSALSQTHAFNGFAL